MSGAALWVVAGETAKPTSAGEDPTPPEPEPHPEPEPASPAEPDVVVAPSVPSRRPATSRRRAVPLAAPEPTIVAPVLAGPVAVERPQPVTARMSGAPLPRHRVRSGALLVVLVIIVGLLVAAVIGIVVAVLAFALRAAVTS